jgi:hypothetical protein
MADNTFCYLNTDLDVKSADDLTALAAEFKTRGVTPCHVTKEENGFWQAMFETYDQYGEPEPTISALLQCD